MNSQQPRGKLTKHLVEENSSLRNKLRKTKPQCGIKNIIFDFGGVLIDWNPRYLYRDIFQNEVEMEFFLKEICTSKWNLKQDAGRSFDEATQELISKFPQYENEIRPFYASWATMIGGPIQENVDLIDILKDKYHLYRL